MAVNRQLLNQIRTTLGNAISPSLSTHSNASDLYEGFVWALVIEAARNEQATIRFVDVNGNEVPTKTPPVACLRTSPGVIWSTEHDYCHAEILFSGKARLEAHIGIRVAGKSKVPHECDVLVLRSSEAETCRRGQAFPRYNKLLMSIECKFYQNARLALGLGRAFLGLTMELAGVDPFFVTDNSSDSIEQLMNGHAKTKKAWDHLVVPSNTVEVYRLRGKFETVFQVYKRSNRR